MTNIYDMNQTMRLIGMQPFSMIYENPGLMRQINDIAETRSLRRGQYIEPLLDAYVLGYMHGKRADRQRRKGNEILITDKNDKNKDENHYDV